MTTRLLPTRAAWTFLLAGLSAVGLTPMRASSHMDAPLITLDPAANTTDVYAFVAEHDNQKYLEVALGVYPFEEPGVGPNKYNFDDNVLYTLIVSSGADVAAGNDTITYQFKFTTGYKTQGTILQSYVGVVQTDGDAAQNLTQTYTVTKTQGSNVTNLGSGIVPPNNEGNATPLYNQGNSGLNPAKAGVSDPSQLDPYTAGAVMSLSNGYRSFCGQREDGFYGDINSIFDLLNLRTGAQNSFDSQAGYNVHMIVLEIPVSELGGDQQIVGVYATTSRRATTVLSSGAGSTAPVLSGGWVQVARQGNPLFNEAMVALQDKDLYSRTKPSVDATTFQKYAASPELASLINTITFGGQAVAPTTGRTDLVGIFIPDLIKVDLSTGAARLAAGGANFPDHPDQAGFSNQSIFGGDTLTSTVQAGFGNGTVPGGWPNGRRFGDDVISIAVTAIISDLRTSPPTIRSAANIDNVPGNDAIYNTVFPYGGTPFNGRNYAHNAGLVPAPIYNFSTRGWAGVGNAALMGGFIVRGPLPAQVLVRALGPSLANYGVQSPLSATTLTVYHGSTVMATNSGWQATQQAAIQATGFAPGSTNEAAVLLTVPPGAYTVAVSGPNGATGVSVVDAFVLNPN
ncbi:MAG TPA: DUF4331 domain-containing protein [Opitutaceae bacterium]|jgi:hypothetical protein